MKKQIHLKSTSLKQFAALVTPKASNEKWQSFLKLKGHTEESFACLPEHIKLSLRFSYGSKNQVKAND